MVDFDYTHEGESGWARAWDAASEAAGAAWDSAFRAAMAYGASPAHAGAMAREAALRAARQA